MSHVLKYQTVLQSINTIQNVVHTEILSINTIQNVVHTEILYGNYRIPIVMEYKVFINEC